MKAQQVYETKTAAFEYLEARGYGIKKSAFYNHCKAGKCLVQKNKSILLIDLLEYIETHLKTGASSEAQDAALSRRERELDVEIKREKHKKYEIENRKADDLWMQRDDHEQQVAGLLAVAMELLRQKFSLEAAALLHAAGGDPGRMPEFLNELDVVVESAFNDLAGAHEFDVVFNVGDLDV